MMKETELPCKNCGQKHPIGVVSGIKMNINTGCRKYEPKGRQK